MPLSTQAQTEARVLMLSSNNVRSPASGKVLTVPSQDMVFGVYFLTTEKESAEGESRVFADFDDAINAYDARSITDLQAKVTVRVSAFDSNVFENGRRIFRIKTSKNDYYDIDVTDRPQRFETTVG